MALKKYIVLNAQVSINTNGWSFIKGIEKCDLGGCYIKVETVNGNKNNVSYTVSIKSELGASKTEIFNFVPDMMGPNFIKQAYLDLKNKPEFADAVDC